MYLSPLPGTGINYDSSPPAGSVVDGPFGADAFSLPQGLLAGHEQLLMAYRILPVLRCAKAVLCRPQPANICMRKSLCRTQFNPANVL